MVQHFPCFITFLPLRPDAVQGNTKREFYVKKTITLECHMKPLISFRYTFEYISAQNKDCGCWYPITSGGIKEF